MNGKAPGILGFSVHETPVAVIDLETTGLTAGADRIVELSVVRLEPGREPHLVLDTLLDPRRPVAATEIHGITDEDVRGAPTFHDIVGNLLRSVAGCTVAAYNVYFDIKFLCYEMAEAGVGLSLPHLCLMYMRPMLGLGKRLPLADACAVHGVDNPMAHTAAGDAQAAADLMSVYLGHMRSEGIRTYADLARRRQYKFVESFVDTPAPASAAQALRCCERLRPRATSQDLQKVAVTASAAELTGRPANPLADYWDALKAALADLRITQDEVRSLANKKLDLGLTNEQVRMLHARLFAGVISQFIGDRRLDDRECKILNRVYTSLRELGWAPGDLDESPTTS